MESLPGGEAVVLPEPIDDDCIEALAMHPEPGSKARSVLVAGEAGPEGVQGIGVVPDRRAAGAVQRGYLHAVAVACMHRREQAHGFGWATASGADGGDEVEEVHPGWSLRP